MAVNFVEQTTFLIIKVTIGAMGTQNISKAAQTFNRIYSGFKKT